MAYNRARRRNARLAPAGTYNLPRQLSALFRGKGDRARPAHDFSTIEPEILDEDMRPGDIVFVLEHLRFGRNALGTLRIDRQVRDYLVAALRRHHAARVQLVPRRTRPDCELPT